MDDAVLVGVLDPGGDLLQDGERLRRREPDVGRRSGR
jgi:hypothetical protein